MTGVPEDPVFHGYTCKKGRAYPAMHSDPERLLESQKRQPDGSFRPIDIEEAMDEIADRLLAIRDDFGTRAIALYLGTQCGAHPATGPLAYAWQNALGLEMSFTAATIDSPGKIIAQAMHGFWSAPGQELDRPDAILLVGANPIVSNHMGLPCSNPGRWLKDQRERGCQMVVIDPRRTETARLADLHLAVRPGFDAPVLAAILRTIFEEELQDQEFLDAEVEGVAELRRAVAPFDARIVAPAAGVEVADLVEAARIFGRAKRGYSAVGTGPNMNGPGATLIEYLALCLYTVCGRWLRAGERVPNPGVLLPDREYRAQAAPRQPAYGFGEKLRVRGLSDTAAGLSTAALAEEILLEGEGRVRALVSVGGNPVNVWPDQLRTVAALEKADLVVQFDNRMSETARRADFVIAGRMPFEMPGFTLLTDSFSRMLTAYGYAEPWAAVSPALVPPPPGSRLIEAWEVFYGLGQRMGLSLALAGESGSHPLDMERKPTSAELFEKMTAGSRIPLSQVAAKSGGGVFEGDPVYVAPKDPDCSERLNVGHTEILTDLADVAETIVGGDATSSRTERRFRLLSRRDPNVYNSTGTGLQELIKSRGYNPAYLCRPDLAKLGLASGDRVRIVSDHGEIIGIVEVDDGLRPGVISMSHAWGATPDRDDAVRRIGSNTNRLMSPDRGWDRYSGIPTMSNLPVDIIAVPD